jgi:hypothetical protein
MKFYTVKFAIVKKLANLFPKIISKADISKEENFIEA